MQKGTQVSVIMGGECTLSSFWSNGSFQSNTRQTFLVWVTWLRAAQRWAAVDSVVC